MVESNSTFKRSVRPCVEIAEHRREDPRRQSAGSSVHSLSLAAPSDQREQSIETTPPAGPLGELFAIGYPLQVLEPPLELPMLHEHLYRHPRFEADPAHVWLRSQVSRCIHEFFARIRGQELNLIGTWPALPDERRAAAAPRLAARRRGRHKG
jgi:hypothetical protein